MFEGTLIEYITAFGGGTITLHLLKTWDDGRKGRLAKKQQKERAQEMIKAQGASFLTRGRLWEISAHRAGVLATRLGATEDNLPEFPPSMDAPYPELEQSKLE